MRNTLIKIFFGLLIILNSCQQGSNPKLVEQQEPMAHIVIAEEVVQANSYTYLRVAEGNTSYWIAVNKMDAEEGETYFFTEAMLMRDFESKDLERKFDSIYFVQTISSKPVMETERMTMDEAQGRKPVLERKDISVDVAEGGITIAELYSNRDAYSDKTVRIRGEVVKVNPEIMGINWVHIQDGTGDNDNFDLTVTTNDKVEVGAVVTFEGKITLEKDFGAGYFYEVIMENARQPDLQY